MYTYQLTPAFYKNLSDKFNPVWLRKAELHLPPLQTGLKCRTQQACNYMQHHDQAWL